MRAVIQRVREASVTIEDAIVGRIGPGFLILLGMEAGDGETDVQWLSHKIAGLRIFSDDQGKMNLSVREISGELLVVSQFTLHASCKKGFRPSFIRAADPSIAVPLYEQFKQELGRDTGRPVASGKFGALMQVALVNDGPVTILLDSKVRE